MELKVLKTKKDKEEFLENDLIDRLIRIEQKVSAKFGKFINYKDTYCYKNLTPKNKERYEKYLKNKKNKKFAFASLFFIPFLGTLMLSKGITGNVIAEQTSEKTLTTLQGFFIGLLIGVILVFGIQAIINYRRKKRIEPLFNPLENIKKKAL
ncbi:MAG: hypothetical protein QW103_02900 [Candidatus Pacearchaeota archaeon]